jgi:hypothetical protein
MGWRDHEARQAWLASVGSLEVPVDAWPEGALCDPVKMVFTDRNNRENNRQIKTNQVSNKQLSK